MQVVDLTGLTREQIEQLLKAAAIVINRVSVHAYCVRTRRVCMFSMINSRHADGANQMRCATRSEVTTA